ncbi:MAG: tRNA (guanosine(46)-N7)-methyltransferase TrmB [Huintestinicola sp.]
MRIRKKKWARPELDKCSYFIDGSSELKGHWHEAFEDNSRPLYLEVGCGKCFFAAQHALKYPDINIIAADIKEDMLGVGRRTVEQLFSENSREHDNLILLRANVANLTEYFAPEDTVDRIYINFCNPWNRGKHNKRRLTHPRQLAQYKTILKPDGEIRFKTDDDELFEDSVEYFESEGFEITYITRDLHNSDFEGNLVTEHEKMFSDEGKTIKFLIARVSKG